MEKKEKICASARTEYIGAGICRCETIRNWLTMNKRSKKVKVERGQNANTCSRRETELLRLYEARVAQQNIRERDVKMYKLIVDSYVQSTKHHLPESVFQDWFGEAGLMKLPGTGRAVRPQATGSDAGEGSQGTSLKIKEETDNSDSGTQQYLCNGCKETINRNPSSRVAFLGDGNMVNGMMSNIFVAKIICRGCQANKTMDLAGKHVLCFGCDMVKETQ